MRKILIVGATSAIAEATARRFAAAGDRLFLVAQDAERLESVADDLAVRGASLIATATLDMRRYDRHAAMIDEAATVLEGLDTVLIAHGTLPDQKACEASFELTREALEVNAVSVISLLTHVVNRFEKYHAGTIVVISSVADDRGRRSNYVYGAAKGCLNVFLQGGRAPTVGVRHPHPYRQARLCGHADDRGDREGCTLGHSRTGGPRYPPAHRSSPGYPLYAVVLAVDYARGPQPADGHISPHRVLGPVDI